MTVPEVAQKDVATRLREKKPHHHFWMGGKNGGARLTPAQRRRIIDGCIESDGAICRSTVCLLLREENLEGKPSDYRYDVFTVDHIDNNSSNNWFDNLQIAHGPCNNKDRFNHPPRSVLHALERENFTHEQLHAKVETHEIAQAENVPLVIALNYDHEEKFRFYYFRRVLEAIQKRDMVTKKMVRPNAREYSGSGLASSYSYQERLFADELGPLILDFDKYAGKKGTEFIRFRDDKDRNLMPERLCEKYPKTGNSREAQPQPKEQTQA